MYRGTFSPCTAPESFGDSNLRFWGISLLWDQREKYKVSVSGCLGYQKFWFHNYILLGVPKYWKPSCIVFLFRGSEILYPLLCCLENQKFLILSCVVWGSEILNPLLCSWGMRNSESSSVLFGGSLGDCLEEFYDPCKQGDVSCEF